MIEVGRVGRRGISMEGRESEGKGGIRYERMMNESEVKG